MGGGNNEYRFLQFYTCIVDKRHSNISTRLESIVDNTTIADESVDIIFVDNITRITHLLQHHGLDR